MVPCVQINYFVPVVSPICRIVILWQEEDKKMKSLAVIPPMLLDARQRQLRFINNNGHIEDPKAEFKERQLYNVWTNAEKEIFKEKYLLQPKNFFFIAQFLERKVSQEKNWNWTKWSL